MHTYTQDHIRCMLQLLFSLLQIYDELHKPSGPFLPTLHARITHLSPCDPCNARIIKCKTIITDQQAHNLEYPYENYLVILTSAGSNSSVQRFGIELEEHGPKQQCLGLVQATQRSSLTDHSSSSPPTWELILELWVFGMTQSLSRRNQSIHLRPVTSLATTLRQWNALIKLHTSLLVRDILWPRGGVYFGVNLDLGSPSSPDEVHTMVSTCTTVYCLYY